MTSSVDQLKSTIAQKGGMARPNNFVVELPPLAGMSGREMNVLCRTAQLPAKQILTHDRRIGMEFEKIAYGYAVDDVTLSFMVMNDYGVRKYFDEWRNLILDEDAHTVNYKSEYQKRVVIHQLANTIPSLFASASINVGPISAGLSAGIGIPLGGRLDISTTVYTVELINAFPTTIGEISFNNEQDSFIEMTVAFSYTNWKTLPAGQKQITFTL
tara:strand:+ start:4196 stop:4837 length:642 start_codon:yes stop_codon:yes gene_type:complete